MFVKIVVLGIAGVIITDFFKQYNKEFSSVMGLAFLIVSVGLLLSYISQYKHLYKSYSDMLNIDDEILKDVSKLIFITILKSISYDFCLENGYRTLSSKIDFASKIAALSVVLPYIQKLYVNIIQLFL